MKTQIMKFAMLIVVLSSATFSCQKKEETVKEEVVAVDAEKLKAEIQGLENAYADALNAGNAEGVVAYYSDDAVSYSQNKAPLNGKAAIKASIEEDLKEGKGMKASFTTNEVHPSNDGNMVVELGAYKVVDSTNTPKYTGNYMAVFHKKDGKYECVRDMAASDKPKEEKK